MYKNVYDLSHPSIGKLYIKNNQHYIRLRKNSYQVRVSRNKKQFCVGSFNTLQDAISARDIFLQNFND